MTSSSARVVPRCEPLHVELREVELARARVRVARGARQTQALFESMVRKAGGVHEAHLRRRPDHRVVIGAHLGEARDRVSHSSSASAGSRLVACGARSSSDCSRPPKRIDSPSRWKKKEVLKSIVSGSRSGNCGAFSVTYMNRRLGSTGRSSPAVAASSRDQTPAVRTTRERTLAQRTVLHRSISGNAHDHVRPRPTGGHGRGAGRR